MDPREAVDIAFGDEVGFLLPAKLIDEVAFHHPTAVLLDSVGRVLVPQRRRNIFGTEQRLPVLGDRADVPKLGVLENFQFVHVESTPFKIDRRGGGGLSRHAFPLEQKHFAN